VRFRTITIYPRTRIAMHRYVSQYYELDAFVSIANWRQETNTRSGACWHLRREFLSGCRTGKVARVLKWTSFFYSIVSTSVPRNDLETFRRDRVPEASLAGRRVSGAVYAESFSCQPSPHFYRMFSKLVK
jgi:hypothetical protein